MELEDVQPGAGSVRIANGVDEPVQEVGRLGPLDDVEKVRGFTRMLVSAGKLADKFGKVVFDSNSVSVVSRARETEICTRIGHRTASGLYSYEER